MRFLTYIITILMFSAFGAHAEEGTILAFVGDDIITVHDVDSRVNLILSSHSDTSSGVDRKKVAADALQTLIEERLITQEAKRLKVTVSNQEMQHAISVIEKQNSVPPGQFDTFIADKHIPKKELLNQLQSQVLWSKLINYTIRPKVVVSQDDIDEEVKHLKASDALVSLKQLLFPIHPGERAESVKRHRWLLKLAQGRIHGCNDVGAAAASIHEVAPDMIQVQMSNMQPELRDTVKRLPVGKVSPIIENQGAMQVIIVCAIENATNETIEPTDADKAHIGDMLQQNKIELQARQYMRDIRQKTYVEIVKQG